MKMDDISLNNDRGYTLKEELMINEDSQMTVKEVAEALGCNPETVKRHIRELYPVLMENGKTTYLNETQITVILEKMKQESGIGAGVNLQNQIVGTETAQSRALRIDFLHRQIEAEMQAELDEQKARAEKAENKLAITAPKAETLDKITASDSDISVRELASVLAIPHLGQNNMFQRLRADGYIDALNHSYRRYVEAGLMYEKEYYVPSLDATKRQLRITQKGVAYFANKYIPLGRKAIDAKKHIAER
jgi:phage antirepressor YoqD-like protein